nr:lasso peptide biosynthesis B2 protein [Cohnella kolymensis]
MLLFVEAFFFLGWARLLLVVMPFSKVAATLGASTQETPHTIPNTIQPALIQVHNAIGIVSNHTMWESKCLVKAIAALKMLERRRIESTLYLGAARDEQGRMIAHAWLRSGSFCVTGMEGMHRFTVVGKFAKRIT